MKKDILLVIPTLNEFGNIQKIYKKIRKSNKNIKLLFIDDNSKDGTQKIIKEIKKKIIEYMSFCLSSFK